MKALADILNGKLQEDERLFDIFNGFDLEVLFIEFPLDFEVPGHLLEQHENYFQMGLNEHHFDILMEHLVDTLVELRLKRHLIEEVIDLVGKLRKAFQEGAALFGGSHEEERNNHEDESDMIDEELAYLRRRLALL